MRCSYCGKEFNELVPIAMDENTILGFIDTGLVVYCSQECHDLMKKEWK